MTSPNNISGGECQALLATVMLIFTEKIHCPIFIHTIIFNVPYNYAS